MYFFSKNDLRLIKSVLTLRCTIWTLCDTISTSHARTFHARPCTPGCVVGGGAHKARGGRAGYIVVTGWFGVDRNGR